MDCDNVGPMLSMTALIEDNDWLGVKGTAKETEVFLTINLQGFDGAHASYLTCLCRFVIASGLVLRKYRGRDEPHEKGKLSNVFTGPLCVLFA